MHSFVPTFSTLAANLDIICVTPVSGSEEVEAETVTSVFTYWVWLGWS